MKVTKYRCLACLDAFDSLEEATYHVEHAEDAVHTEFREKHGSDSMIQMIEVEDLEDLDLEHSQENLETQREWSDFPKGYKLPDNPVKYSPNTQKYLAYPYSPYFYDVEGKAYFCAEHHVGSQNVGEYMKHMQEYHKDDFNDFLRHHVKQGVINKLRFQHGSSELLTDEQLEKFVDDKIAEIMITAELKAKPIESLTGFIDAKFEDLKPFLSGSKDLCPLCNRIASSVIDPRYTYLTSRIIESLKKGMQLTGKEKYYTDYAKRKYQGKWKKAEDIDLCLLNNIHMATFHKETYQRLASEEILTGDLVKFLLTFEGKPEEQHLAKGLVAGKDKNSTKAENVLSKWLEDNKKAKTTHTR